MIYIVMAVTEHEDGTRDEQTYDPPIEVKKDIPWSVIPMVLISRHWEDNWHLSSWTG